MSGKFFQSPLRRVLFIASGYLIVTFAIFVLPAQSDLPAPGERPMLARGVEVWRQSQCYVCHSLYGLGGHLGPDLTDIYSARGADYVKVMLAAGRPGMPRYDKMPVEDTKALLAYLQQVDQTAEYPLRGKGIPPFGRIATALGP